jgi:hypothetical protein
MNRSVFRIVPARLRLQTPACDIACETFSGSLDDERPREAAAALFQIPANRDFYRDFLEKWPPAGHFGSKFPLFFRNLEDKIPTRPNRDFSIR